MRMDRQEQLKLWPEKHPDCKGPIGHMAGDWLAWRERLDSREAAKSDLEESEKWVWAVYLRGGMRKRIVKRRPSGLKRKPQLALGFDLEAAPERSSQPA